VAVGGSSWRGVAVDVRWTASAGCRPKWGARVDSRNVAPQRHARAFWSYVAVVITIGALGEALSLWRLSLGDLTGMGAPFGVVLLLLVVAELRPLFVPGSTDVNGITTATAFVFALLLAFGVAPAILAQSTATLISDRRRRHAWWRTGFNISQYALSWAAAAGILRLLGVQAAPLHPLELGAGQLPAILAAAVTYFVVNDVLVSLALALRGGMSVRSELFADFRYQAAATGSLLAISPLVVVVMQRSAFLVPLFLLPLFAVYATAAISVQKEHQADHDALTGLPNRKLLITKTEEALAAASRSDTALALCLLDLDQFKNINDTEGHHVGDQVLQLVAERINAVLRPSDVLARLGGDEFVVLIPFEGDPEVALVAARRVADSLQPPMTRNGVDLPVRGSIGVAIYPPHGRDYTTLMRCADAAMYVAKRNGHGVELHHPPGAPTQPGSAPLLPGQAQRGVPAVAHLV
jgi:diguanylate cyclase (GGDEF)-like protein